MKEIKKPIYPNLEAELKRKGINRGEYAKLIGISAGGASKKLNGDVEFSIGEMKRTKELLDETMDYLFA